MSVETILCVKAMCANNFLCEDLTKIIVLYIKTHFIKHRVNDKMYQGFNRLLCAHTEYFVAEADTLWDIFMWQACPIYGVLYPCSPECPEKHPDYPCAEAMYVDFDDVYFRAPTGTLLVDLITDEIEDFELVDAETW